MFPLWLVLKRVVSTELLTINENGEQLLNVQTAVVKYEAQSNRFDEDQVYFDFVQKLLRLWSEESFFVEVPIRRGANRDALWRKESRELHITEAQHALGKHR